MKRRLFKLALFLFLGAVVNVSVAWGCAYWMRSPSYTFGFDQMIVSQLEQPRWLVEWTKGFGGVRYTFWPEQTPQKSGDIEVLDSYPAWSRTNRLDAAVFDKRPSFTTIIENTIVEDARGWPFLALKCELVIASPKAAHGEIFAVNVLGGIPLQNVYRDDLPFVPSILIVIRPSYYAAKALPFQPI